MKRFSHIGGGGRLLSSAQAFFKGCKNLKNCYNGDVTYHIHNGVCMKGIKAFTLAEVLITLGIIGVVAALTIPSLVQKYKEQATVTRVKKFYSAFSQAYTMAINENGTIDTWGLEDSEIDVDEDGNSGYSDSSLEQYEKFFNIIGKYLQKVEYEPIRNTRGKGFVMSDGTQIIAIWLQPSRCTGNGINHSDTYCGDFYIKTDNKPARKDDGTFNSNVFVFNINPYRIFPRGTDNTEFKDKCLSGTDMSRCTGWLILNENMDYLHCKDLDINTKTKCK